MTTADRTDLLKTVLFMLMLAAVILSSACTQDAVERARECGRQFTTDADLQACTGQPIRLDGAP